MELNRDYIQIAETLHTQYCRYNHTDGCSWFYESWDNPHWSRMHYYLVVKYLVEESKINFSQMNLGDLSVIYGTLLGSNVNVNRDTGEYELKVW